MLRAFTRQVLLRPARIGTLALFGGMIAVALVGAEGWWIVLGITLFHAAACTLTVMWVEIPRTGPPQRVSSPGVKSPVSWVVNGVPLQRRPGPDE